MLVFILSLSGKTTPQSCTTKQRCVLQNSQTVLSLIVQQYRTYRNYPNSATAITIEWYIELVENVLTKSSCYHTWLTKCVDCMICVYKFIWWFIIMPFSSIFCYVFVCVVCVCLFACSAFRFTLHCLPHNFNIRLIEKGLYCTLKLKKNAWWLFSFDQNKVFNYTFYIQQS